MTLFFTEFDKGMSGVEVQDSPKAGHAASQFQRGLVQ